MPSIGDILVDTPRIIEGTNFIQNPNFVTAAQELTLGQFVLYTQSGSGEADVYEIVADYTKKPTHLVLKSGINRNTADEIANQIGIVNQGEPVQAITGGPGVVRIPYGVSATLGDQLTVVDGFVRPVKDVFGSDTEAYVVGKCTETVTVDTDPVYAEAWITLPGQYVTVTTLD